MVEIPKYCNNGSLGAKSRTEMCQTTIPLATLIAIGVGLQAIGSG